VVITTRLKVFAAVAFIALGVGCGSRATQSVVSSPSQSNQSVHQEKAARLVRPDVGPDCIGTWALPENEQWSDPMGCQLYVPAGETRKIDVTAKGGAFSYCNCTPLTFTESSQNGWTATVTQKPPSSATVSVTAPMSGGSEFLDVEWCGIGGGTQYCSNGGCNCQLDTVVVNIGDPPPAIYVTKAEAFPSAAPS
jgi:hypothetical protein